MIRWCRGIIAIAGGLYFGSTWAGLDEIGNDGWYTWKVDARLSAPVMCCFTWNRGVATRRSCDLDSHRGGFGSNDEFLSDDAGLQLYVHREAGQITEIRALSASCPVTATSGIREIDPVTGSESIAWLSSNVGRDEDLSDDAILAISMHAGGGIDALIDLVENRSLDMDLRESALFWLAHTDTDEAYAYIDRLLTR